MADRNLELEAQIAKNPDDTAAYQVYADWFSDNGNPLGELISLSLAFEKSPGDGALETKIAGLHAEHDETLLGELAEPAEGMSLVWRRGFLDEVMIGEDEPAEIDLAETYATFRSASRDLPIAGLLRKLTFGSYSDDDGEPSWEGATSALVEHGAPPWLKELHYDRGSYWDISWTHLASLEPAYAKLAHLEKLYIELGHMELGAIDLPALRDFEVYTGGFTGDNMRSVLAANWPKLERLVLRFGSSSDYGGTTKAEDVLPLFESKNFGNLSHLALANAPFTDEIVLPLAKSKLLSQLKTLDLSWGFLGDAGAQLLIEHADAFRHLSHIDANESYITAELVTTLRKVLPQVTTTEQKTPEEYNGRVYRYCHIGE